MKNIVLIGMPGTGKSTVGVILAKRMGYGFLDTDILLAEHEGRTLPVIIAEEGFEGFLEAEGRMGITIDRESTVIATGGSMVFSEAAMNNLRRNGVVIWLKTSLAELEKRLYATRETRGVAAPKEMSIAEIYEQRRPLYERYADLTVNCLSGTDNVVHQILELLDNR